MVMLPAFDQKTKAEPLFDLAGGPGAASTDGVNFYANDGRVYRRRHDVVLVDQRGTGKSNGLKAETREKRPQDFLTEMPPQRGEEVARYLSNSRHVIIPQAGDGVDGLAEPECVDRIIMEFMEKGDAKDLDIGCVERMAPPPFAINGSPKRNEPPNTPNNAKKD